MKKSHFEYFIADYFPALNKKDPVLLKSFQFQKNVKIKEIEYN